LKLEPLSVRRKDVQVVIEPPHCHQICGARLWLLMSWFFFWPRIRVAARNLRWTSHLANLEKIHEAIAIEA
jgi:hypothetical protein